jgi:hypothetical protein
LLGGSSNTIFEQHVYVSTPGVGHKGTPDAAGNARYVRLLVIMRRAPTGSQGKIAPND